MGIADQPAIEEVDDRSGASEDTQAFRGLLVAAALTVPIWLAIGGIVVVERLLTA